MISSINNLNPYSYHITSSGSSGKLYVPVNPGAVVYAQFDHISGVAAGKNQHGVSLTKIQILNTLIENLSRIKPQSQNANAQESTSPISEEQANVLIKTYQKQIAQAVQAAKTTPYMLSGATPDIGSLFSVNA